MLFATISRANSRNLLWIWIALAVRGVTCEALRPGHVAFPDPARYPACYVQLLPFLITNLL